jgi:transposase
MGRITTARIHTKLQAVALRGQGYSNDQIAAITGYNSNYVGELCKKYVQDGIEAMRTDGRKGGNNRHMNETEANEFLKQFEDKAVEGQVINVEELAQAYDEAVGKEHKSRSSIYYFLHRHGWREIVPKKQHPGKASEEEIEASKKLTLSLRK